MPLPTPAYPFDPALVDASIRGALHEARRDAFDLTPHAPYPPAGGTPVVLGGVLRSDSPFLDAAAPSDGMVFVPVAPQPLEGADAVDEPAAPETPFDRAAVERARVRAARPVERVEGTVLSDDGVAEHVCDVTDWLAGATAREVEALVRAGWTGAVAEDVAAVLADDDPEVADVLRHARRADAEVVVEIDGRAAMDWLARHRPAIVDALDEMADESRDAG